ncbi:hypothetical protein PCANC_27805 [Puccinia coronata f. sp. avenae]|uniref:Uncharacterized protein n=1 Tax=Puccinia coronata f. sp. avenae TaxID=200324 RepID=A0A2N5RYI7_9BASI|nr:hypothetical protein PCANC_27805 [Puccinia coronata f. sp. avenae]
MKEASQTIEEIQGQVAFRPSISSTPADRKREEEPDEHIFHSYTPASFELLHPVLSLKLEKVDVKLILSPTHDSREKLSHWCDIEPILASIIITEREMSFYSSERDRSLVVPHRMISLHGLSNTDQGQSQQVYCQLNPPHETTTGSEEEDAKEEDPSESMELIITPHNLDEKGQANEAQQIFRALSYCASLHPAPTPLSQQLSDQKEDHHLLSALLEHDQSPPPTTDPLADTPSNRFQPY